MSKSSGDTGVRELRADEAGVISPRRGGGLPEATVDAGDVQSVLRAETRAGTTVARLLQERRASGSEHPTTRFQSGF